MSTSRQHSLPTVFVVALIALTTAIRGPVVAANPALPTPIGTIQLPEDGLDVAVNPLTGVGYVGLTGNVGVFDLASRRYVDTIAIYPSAQYAIFPLGINPCSNRLYTGSRIVDLPSRTLASLPCGGDDIAVDTQRNRIYLGLWAYYQNTPDSVCVVDGRTGSKIRSIDLDTGYYREHVWVAVNSVTGRLYVSYSQDESLHVYEGDAYSQVDSLAVEHIGRVAVNSGTNRVYVVSGNNTLVLDGSTLAIVGQISGFFDYLLVNSLTNRIYSVSTRLKVADGATNQVVGDAYLTGGAQAPALDPLTGRVYFVGAYAGSRDKVYVFQDVPAPQGATLPCPIVWREHLPMVLKR